MKIKWRYMALFGGLTLALVQCRPLEGLDSGGARPDAATEAVQVTQTPEFGQGTPEDPAPPSAEIPSRDSADRTIRTQMPEMVNPPDQPDTPHIVGEVPTAILDPILNDLVQRIGVDKANIQVVRAQEVIWNDGSLGCPQPGVFYTQALVDGYWVILVAAGRKYDYRAAATGYFFLCENGFPPVTPPATPDS